MNQPLAPLGLQRRISGRTLYWRAGRIGLRMLAAIALVGGSVAVAGIADGTPAAAANGTCDGVIVVVDFTDLGGDLDVRCAEGEQASGRDALTAAAFSLTDSQPGFLCAINAMPDPCPESFDGSFWAYWHSAPEGEWTSYQVGADSSTPATGDIEGWRYNDGTTPPGLSSAEAAATVSPAPTPEKVELPNVAVPDEASQSTSNEDSIAEQSARQNAVLIWTVVGFGGLILAVVIAFIAQRRRGNRGSSAPEVRD